MTTPYIPTNHHPTRLAAPPPAPPRQPHIPDLLLLRFQDHPAPFTANMRRRRSTQRTRALPTRRTQRKVQFLLDILGQHKHGAAGLDAPPGTEHGLGRARFEHVDIALAQRWLLVALTRVEEVAGERERDFGATAPRRNQGFGLADEAREGAAEAGPAVRVCAVRERAESGDFEVPKTDRAAGFASWRWGVLER